MAESLLDSAFLWLDHVFRTYYSSIVAAVIILLVGFIAGKLAGRIVQRVLHGMEVDTLLKKVTQADIAVEHALGRLTSYLLYAISVVAALNQLGVTTTILQMIIAGVIIIMVIAAALAVKDFIPNAMAGLYIHKNKIIGVGQRIRVKGVEGKVVAVTLVETKLQTAAGDMVHIPNSAITRSEIVILGGRKKKGVEKKRGRNP